MLSETFETNRLKNRGIRFLYQLKSELYINLSWMTHGLTRFTVTILNYRSPEFTPSFFPYILLIVKTSERYTVYTRRVKVRTNK